MSETKIPRMVDFKKVAELVSRFIPEGYLQSRVSNGAYELIFYIKANRITKIALDQEEITNKFDLTEAENNLIELLKESKNFRTHYFSGNYKFTVHIKDSETEKIHFTTGSFIQNQSLKFIN